jgi:hypothetical protein
LTRASLLTVFFTCLTSSNTSGHGRCSLKTSYRLSIYMVSDL